MPACGATSRPSPRPRRRARLTGERRRFLHKTVDTFRRHGADLDPAGKKRLEAIDVELTQITTKFAENVLDSTNAFELVITNESELAGLPPTAVASARESAQRKGLRRLALHPAGAELHGGDDVSGRCRDPPADVRGVRSARHRRASGTIGRSSCAFWNCGARRRRCWASRNFADLVLEDRMAHSGERALNFLEDLKAKTERRFGEENRELLEFRRSVEGADAAPLSPWDVGYYAEKQRAALYDFDEEALRPYFPLERVVAGLFELVQRLYGISVEEETGVPVWDPGGPLLQRPRRERHVPRRVLRRLVSAREQARRRVDGRADHGRSGGGRLPAAPGPDLRQSDAARGRQAGAA